MCVEAQGSPLPFPLSLQPCDSSVSSQLWAIHPNGQWYVQNGYMSNLNVYGSNPSVCASGNPVYSYLQYDTPGVNEVQQYDPTVGQIYTCSQQWGVCLTSSHGIVSSTCSGTPSQLWTLVEGDLPSVLTTNTTATASVQWTSMQPMKPARITYQVTTNLLSMRGSKSHDASWKSLSNLGASMARLQAWYPFPVLSVPSLDFPSGLNQCGNVGRGHSITLSCRHGGVIDSIGFASYGNPDGWCGSFLSDPTCSSPSTLTAVTNACLGLSTCTLQADEDAMGVPGPSCSASSWRLAVQATCNPPQNNTYWDFQYLDPYVIDFLDAVGEDSLPVVDFSTIPSWMYEETFSLPFHRWPDNPYHQDWGYDTGNTLIDPSCEQVGQWFGRLAAWYLQGGFYDEYGLYHYSGHHFNITYWEVLNEYAYEHGTSDSTYLCIYDQVVKWVRLMADPDHQIQFVGLALAQFQFPNNNLGPFFDRPLDWISLHWYCGPSYSVVRDSLDAYNECFHQFDLMATHDAPSMLNMAAQVGAKVSFNELGIILQNEPTTTLFPLVYFNAQAALFAYMFGTLSMLGVDAVGMSQAVGYPPLSGIGLPGGPYEGLYSSVTFLDWRNGNATARYWVLKLLLELIVPGDTMMNTHSSSVDTLYVQGYVGEGGTRKLLMVNKKSYPQSLQGELQDSTVYIIDERTGFDPPRVMTSSSDTLILDRYAVAIAVLSQ